MPARKFLLHRLAEGKPVKQELRCARGLRAQLGQRHTAAPASHSCQLQRVYFTAALPVLDNSGLEPSSGVTGTVSDLPE